jgi:hypothetical protein
MLMALPPPNELQATAYAAEFSGMQAPWMTHLAFVIAHLLACDTIAIIGFTGMSLPGPSQTAVYAAELS